MTSLKNSRGILGKGPRDKLVSHERSLVYVPLHAINRTCWHVPVISRSEAEGQGHHQPQGEFKANLEQFQETNSYLRFLM